MGPNETTWWVRKLKGYWQECDAEDAAIMFSAGMIVFLGTESDIDRLLTEN